jgi:hypothetical protein
MRSRFSTARIPQACGPSILGRDPLRGNDVRPFAVLRVEQFLPDRYRLNRFKSAPIVWRARSSVSGLGIGIRR